MYLVLELIDTLLTVYFWILIATVVMSWLIAFSIVNRHNDIVRQVNYALFRLTEPVLGPIRRLLPDLGGLDISPMVVILVIWFIQYHVLPYAAQRLL